MQLDDVVKTTITGPRVEEAMHRCIFPNNYLKITNDIVNEGQRGG